MDSQTAENNNVDFLLNTPIDQLTIGMMPGQYWEKLWKDLTNTRCEMNGVRLPSDVDQIHLTPEKCFDEIISFFYSKQLGQLQEIRLLRSHNHVVLKGYISQLQDLSDIASSVILTIAELKERECFLNSVNKLFFEEAFRSDTGSVINLSGAGITRFPSEAMTDPGWMDLWDQVLVLDLSHNHLKRLPTEIARLTLLKSLKINNNNISILPVGISSLGNLEELEVQHNQLKTLPDVIGSLIMLRDFDCSHNQLTQLNACLFKCNRLQKLKLSANQVAQLPEEIGQLTALKKLDLSHNQLIEFPSGIRKCQKIEQLNCANNHCSIFPTNILGLVNLKRLNIGHNKMSTLSSKLDQLSCLEELVVNHNYLNCFPKCFRNLSKLVALDCSDNFIEYLPAEILNCQNLQYINCEDNRFVIFPAKLLRLPLLEKMNFNYNQITIENFLAELEANMTEADYQALVSSQRVETGPALLTAFQKMRLSDNDNTEPDSVSVKKSNRY